MRKMRKVPLAPESKGLSRLQSKNAENADKVDTKTQKMRLTGFYVTGFT